MARDAATVETEIDALRASMAQGVRLVTYDGRTVEYRSLREMQAVLGDLQAELAELNGDPRPDGRRYAQFRRGY